MPEQYGSLRERVDADELRRLKEAGAVHLDPRRSRPLWFDGRFLKASDLNREQNYFLTRQADLAVATGTGVIDGLQVEEGSGATRLVIRRGHGVTFGGERVALDRDLTVNLADVPLIQRLNVALGLSKQPAAPLRLRSGLFVVVLRPLEYTANPIAAYPSHVDDTRSVEDSEIIEATAVTLVPFELGSGIADPYLRRAEAAHRIFVLGSDAGVPTSSLPLAMVELERGNLRWIDPHLVRREAGAAHADVLGLGLAPRLLREAQFRQYEAMLDDVAAQRSRLGSGLRFAAADHFRSLPPAGRLPAAALDVATTTQHFFPEEVDVEVSLVPEDELAILVEESLLLPPIDLGATADALASTSVLILVPVPRHRTRQVLRATRTLQPVLRLPTAANRARLKPLDLLASLRTRLPSGAVTAQPVDTLAEAEWQTEVSRHTFLWYTRRRNLSRKVEILGESVEVFGDDLAEEAGVLENVRDLRLETPFTELRERGSIAANLNVTRLLASPALRESPTLTIGAVRELAAVETLDAGAAREVAARFDEEGVGEGVRRVEAEIMENTTRRDGTTIRAAAERNRGRAELLADSGLVPELDRVSRTLAPTELAVFTTELREVMARDGATSADVATVIRNRERSLVR